MLNDDANNAFICEDAASMDYTPASAAAKSSSIDYGSRAVQEPAGHKTFRERSIQRGIRRTLGFLSDFKSIGINTTDFHSSLFHFTASLSGFHQRKTNQKHR
jgi:hypothetical protein